MRRYKPPTADIYKTTVSGYVGQEKRKDEHTYKETRVGQIWLRMYPLGDGFPSKYLELLTFFPSQDEKDTASKDFQTYLKN